MFVEERTFPREKEGYAPVVLSSLISVAHQGELPLKILTDEESFLKRSPGLFLVLLVASRVAQMSCGKPLS